MAQDITEKINSVIATLSSEISDAHKDYVNERIGSQTKAEIIRNSKDIATFRITKLIENIEVELREELSTPSRFNNRRGGN